VDQPDVGRRLDQPGQRVEGEAEHQAQPLESEPTRAVHQTVGVIESVKAVSDIYSPVSGKVTEVNAALNDGPETLNQDPHGKGWIIKLTIKDKSELDSLLSASEYEKYVEGLGA
jgi:glycine cleavage system H lipoate-binding protein